MLKFIANFLAAGLLCCAPVLAQDAAKAKPIPVIGTVTAVDPSGHTVTMKQDKTGTDYVVQLADTKVFIKVEPGAKDIKGGTRIGESDLAVGDRIEVGAMKSDTDPNALVARSVILMSARDLAKAHEEQAAAWQHSTAGVVSAVDPAAHTITVSAHTPDGPKSITVNAASAVFTRYSPDTPKVAATSQFADVQPGDQVRIIGQMGPDGTTMTASNIYSSTFRSVVGTVSSIAPDGKQITIKDLQTKQPITVMLNDESSIHKLPQMMAYGLARRFNPDFKMPQGAGPQGGAQRQAGAQGQAGPGGQGATGQPGQAGASGQGGQGQGGNSTVRQGQQTGQGAGGGMRSGDLSQMLDRLPKISTSDLKNGDAVIVSGSPMTDDKSHLLATNVIAGVEPIFQSASPRQSQALSDWGAALNGSGGGGDGANGGGATGGGAPPQ